MKEQGAPHLVVLTGAGMSAAPALFRCTRSAQPGVSARSAATSIVMAGGRGRGFCARRCLPATDPCVPPAGTPCHPNCRDPPPRTSVAKRTPDPEQDPGALTEEAAADEVERLRAEVRRHDHLYHVEARPELADAEYDRFFQRLKAVEKAHPDLITPDSPTQRVGAEPQEQLTIPHTAPMLSLDSTQDEADVRRFDERVRKAVDGSVEYLLEPKLDGASIELVYEQGALARAVTRGNGVQGEGVTENMKTIPSVPLRLREAERSSPDVLAVRGEVLMYISDFEAFNAQLVEQGEEPYASPRNSAAGAIRQLDPRVTARRKLYCLAYDLLSVRGASFRKDRDVLEALRQWGFRVPDDIELTSSLEEAELRDVMMTTRGVLIASGGLSKRTC